MLFDRDIHAAAPVLPASKFWPACEMSHRRLTSPENDMRRRRAGREISRPCHIGWRRDFRERPFHAALQDRGIGEVKKAPIGAAQYVLVTRLLALLFKLQFH